MVWYDFDGPNDAAETIRLNSVDFISTINTKLTITEGADWVEITNDHDATGTNVQNPTTIEGLNADQLSVTVMARWSNVNSFQATFTTASAWNNDKRFFLFSGPM